MSGSLELRIDRQLKSSVKIRGHVYKRHFKNSNPKLKSVYSTETMKNTQQDITKVPM